MTTVDDAAPTTGRPVGITLLVVLGVLQGLLAAVAGVAALAASDDRELVSDLGLASSAVEGVGIGLLAVGVVTLALAIALARGSNVARTVFAAVATLEIAVTTYSLLTVGDLRLGGVVALAIPVAVLWLLFGAPHTAEFFDR